MIQMKDHPRRCGENLLFATANPYHIGSPPQVRGKHDTTVPAVRQYRITPAGAGKTAIRQPLKYLMIGSPPQVRGKPADMTKEQVLQEDHPRRCGENWSFVMVGFVPLGSPPQVRGKLYRAAGIAEKYRITPAGAGKTYRSDDFRQCAEDHPRRCGENLCFQLSAETIAGSPPQVRGKLAVSGFFAAPVGITPAGAGKTSAH